MKLSRICKIILAVSIAVGIGAIALDWTSIVLSMAPALVGGSAFIIAGHALAGSVCAGQLESGRMTVLMWSGFVSACVSAACWLGLYVYYSLTWSDIVDASKIVVVPTLWAFVCMMASLLLGRRRMATVARIVGGIAMAGAAGSAIFVALGIWTDGRIFHRDMERYFQALAVVAGFGTMLSLVLQRTSSLWRSEDAAEDIVRMPMRVWCPRCGHHQTILTGGSNCSDCGLTIGVMIP